MRTVVHGVLIAAVAVAIAAFGGSVGLDDLWPFLLAAAVAIVPSGSALGRVGAFAIGAVLGWGVFALRAGVLPAGTSTEVILALVGVGLAVLVGVLSVGRLPLWATLAGGAAFLGAYGPVYADSPTLFLSESPLVLGSVLVAAAVAAVIGAVTELLTGTEAAAVDRVDRVELGDGEVV
jgi:hypothetical protein